MSGTETPKTPHSASADQHHSSQISKTPSLSFKVVKATVWCFHFLPNVPTTVDHREMFMNATFVDGYWLENSLMQYNQAVKWKPKWLQSQTSLDFKQIEKCCWLQLTRIKTIFASLIAWIFWKSSHDRLRACAFAAGKKKKPYKHIWQQTQRDGVYDFKPFASARNLWFPTAAFNTFFHGYQQSQNKCLTWIKTQAGPD